MITDEYGDEIVTGKARRNKVCKVNKGAHVFKLEEVKHFDFMFDEMRVFCGYKCACGKKHTEFLSSVEEIKPEIIC